MAKKKYNPLEQLKSIQASSLYVTGTTKKTRQILKWDSKTSDGTTTMYTVPKGYRLLLYAATLNLSCSKVSGGTGFFNASAIQVNNGSDLAVVIGLTYPESGLGSVSNSFSADVPMIIEAGMTIEHQFNEVSPAEACSYAFIYGIEEEL